MHRMNVQHTVVVYTRVLLLYREYALETSEREVV